MQKWCKFWAKLVITIWTETTAGLYFVSLHFYLYFVFTVRLDTFQKTQLYNLQFRDGLASSSYRRSFEVSTTLSGFNLQLDTGHGWSNWHLQRGTQLLSFECSPCRGEPINRVPATAEYLAESSDWGKCNPLHPSWGHLLLLPSQQQRSPPLQTLWGAKGRTGRRKVGRSSNYMWGTQMKEKYLEDKEGARSVTWELQASDLYKSLTKHISLTLTCSKVPSSLFSETF